MASEFFITFGNASNYIKQKNKLIENAKNLPTFLKIVGFHQLLFKGSSQESWEYDVRLFFEPTCIMIEVSESTPEVHTDLRRFISNIREVFEVKIIDEDGEEVNFFTNN